MIMMADAVVVLVLAVFVLALLVGIIAIVAICSHSLKAEQRAFALAGAGLAGKQQALAWISGTWSIRPRVGSPVGGRPALVGERAASDPHLGERKSQ
jgi:hypothetical protein